MDNLEEIKKQISELQNKVNKLENQEKEKNKRWRARINDTYSFVDDSGDVVTCHEYNEYGDNYRYKTRNYFATYEEAEEYKEVMNTYYDLMGLAEELNNGEKIDWNDFDQCKYLISYNNKNKKLEIDNVLKIQDIGQIYCLYDNFLDKAKERIGEDRLKKLFTYERN